MGLLSTVKGIFSRTEITEETFEYESIDNFLSGKREKEDEPQDDVAFKCDQIVDATYQMEDLRVEYEMVTSYFEDIQRIEELPQNARQEIINTAKKIAFLENETSEFSSLIRSSECKNSEVSFSRKAIFLAVSIISTIKAFSHLHLLNN